MHVYYWDIYIYISQHTYPSNIYISNFFGNMIGMIGGITAQAASLALCSGLSLLVKSRSISV